MPQSHSSSCFQSSLLPLGSDAKPEVMLYTLEYSHPEIGADIPHMRSVILCT